MYVCVKCGRVIGFDMVNECVDFNENKQKIRRKSMYYRKYHFQNILNSLYQKKISELVITKDKRYMIYLIKVIDEVLPLVNEGGRRVISRVSTIY